MSRGGCSVWHRGVRLWTVALVLGAMLLALASVAVAVAAEDGQPSGHVMPAFGSVAGGTSVTISGSGFTGATGVTFGGVAATNVTVNGDGTAITATTPAHDTGAAPVVVTKADGTTVTVGGFFFIPATTATSVTVSGVTPATGSTGGHTPVVINGTGFREGAQVTFGTAAATEVHVFAGQIITVLTPAHDLGAVAVTVTNPSGQSGSLDAVYTYVTPPPAPAPTITRIDPATAPASSLSPTSTALDDHHGQIVAITGTGFQPNAAVTFGGTPVDHATTLGDTVILTTPPDHAVGKVDVVVTNPDNGSATLTKGFEYVGPTPGAPPAITAIDPATGTAGAHQFTVVTITGTGFQHDATVKFGSVAAHDIVVVSDSTIITFAPPHDAGAVDVVVTNHDGQSATSPVQFIYTAPAPGAKPTVTKIDPPSGSTTGEHDFEFHHDYRHRLRARRDGHIRRHRRRSRRGDRRHVDHRPAAESCCGHGRYHGYEPGRPVRHAVAGLHVYRAARRHGGGPEYRHFRRRRQRHDHRDGLPAERLRAFRWYPRDECGRRRGRYLPHRDDAGAPRRGGESLRHQPEWADGRPP